MQTTKIRKLTVKEIEGRLKGNGPSSKHHQHCIQDLRIRAETRARPISKSERKQAENLLKAFTV